MHVLLRRAFFRPVLGSRGLGGTARSCMQEGLCGGSGADGRRSAKEGVVGWDLSPGWRATAMYLCELTVRIVKLGTEFAGVGSGLELCIAKSGICTLLAMA